jgi:threonine/homoserine/homoserine lactone efflux protein
MIHNFWVFALASLLLNITPGNDMLYVASRSAAQGVKAGLVSSLGIMLGCLVHVLAAVVGLSAISAHSATAFDIIKYFGAAYLVFLGIKSLLNKKESSFAVKGKLAPLSYGRLFTQGVLTNVLNPKVALFFLAFLPQFIDTGAAHMQGAILLLGIWFDVGGTLVNMLAAVLFGKIGNWLSRSPRFLKMQQRITGLMLIALGIKVAFTSKK